MNHMVVVFLLLGDNNWELDQLLVIFKRELEARERAVDGNQSLPPKNPNRNKRDASKFLTIQRPHCCNPQCLEKSLLNPQQTNNFDHN